MQTTDSFTREFFSWEHGFDQEYNNTYKNCYDVFNFNTKTHYNRHSEPPKLSNIELFSDILKLEDFLVLNTLGKYFNLLYYFL